MTDKPETTTVRMLDSAKPYVGNIRGADGKVTPITLTLGVHVLPTDKAEQLLRDFPNSFQRVEVEAQNPPTPVSPKSSRPAAPASSTESSIGRSSTSRTVKKKEKP